MSARSSLPPALEEPPRPPMTAASVAHEFFEKELEAYHAGSSAAQEPQTVVILQDNCYGHRYSRPRTSRANLSTIVERPERIHASLLGLATAYVRLGGRHAEGYAAPHPKHLPSSSTPPPFRIHKTARRLPLRSPAATAIHGAQWMTELCQMCDAAESKLALSGKELTRPSATGSTNGNAHAEKTKLHEGDLYLCSGSLNALEGALGGVCEGIDSVFRKKGPKRAFVCIRPPGHHCSADMPSGFCWLNNVHVGIGHAVLSHGLTHAAIIDFDLHHGDGSQSITWAHNSRVASMPKSVPLSKKTAIGYFSLHDINSYPCEMGEDEKVRNASVCVENAHGQNIWNVHLQPWKTDDEFWQLYDEKYSVVLKKARDFLKFHFEKLRQAPTHPEPKAAIFLSAGFDASEWESPGMQRHQVNVPTCFYARLTQDVVALAEQEGLGVDGRIISVLEGGYSDRALMSGVLSHLSGLAVSTDANQTEKGNRLGDEMTRKLGKLDINDSSHALPNGTVTDDLVSSNSDWWSLSQLEEIESVVNPSAPAIAPKKNRSDVRPTYTSATQSYTAKIVSPPQGRRSFSGPGASVKQMPVSRPPSPPPPAVDWATAAHELCKLLVPSDRETRSCRPEDLNAEASRARRDRFSTIGVPKAVEAPVTDANRMQLRDRKARPVRYGSDEEADKPLSRADRRKTVADVSLLAEQNKSEPLPSIKLQPARHTRRRSSIASNASSTAAERLLDSDPDPVPGTREPLVIKKPRAPANPHVEGAKPKPVRKQPPVPRFPSTSSTTTIFENDQAPMLSAQENAKAIQPVSEDGKSKDVDYLSSAMRTMSIKLNVPTREEHEARETKAKAAPQGRVPRSTAPKRAPKASSPTKVKGKSVKNGTPLEPLPTEPFPIQHLPQPAMRSDVGQDITALAPPPVSEFPLQPAASEISTNVPSQIEPASDLHMPSHENAVQFHAPFSHAPKDPEQAKPGTPKPEPQQTVPAHGGTPEPRSSDTPITVKRTKQDLPVFTATSPINFAKPDALPSSINQTMQQNGSSANKQGEEALQASAHSSNVNVPTLPEGSIPSQQTTAAYPLKAENRPLPSTSIWDVPDTPQPRQA